MDALDRRALRTLPLERDAIESYFRSDALEREQVRALCASHERLRKEAEAGGSLFGSESGKCERLRNALRDIKKELGHQPINAETSNLGVFIDHILEINK